jgi:UDP-glucuronate 4-epimerase
MSVLVTGGAGFIGSHLVERLLATTDERVVCLDNFDSFYDPARKRTNIESARRHPRYILVEGDITDETTVAGVFETHAVRDVIHLAAQAGVRPSLRRPLHYMHANVRGTLVLLEAARGAGCRRFLSASSSTVYGNDAPVPFREDRLGRVPASPYGVSKRAAEQLCRLYYELHGIPTLSLRFFSAYGPRLRPDLALSIFAAAICDGRPLPLFGGGTAQRDFTYIDDIVDGIIAAWQSDIAGEEINLGNHRPIRMRDLLTLLEQALGRTAQIEHLPEQPGEMRVTCADLDKAQRLIGYQPQTPFEAGIARFTEWFLANR